MPRPPYDKARGPKRGRGPNPHRGAPRGPTRGRPPGASGPRPERGAPHFVAPWVQLERIQPHPHVWRKTLRARSEDLKPGGLAQVYGPEGALIGAGLYAPGSQHALRMLRADGQRFDEAWLRERLTEAVALRREVLGLDAVSEAWRVIHGEGDELPGLIIDRYGPVLSVEVFTEGWLGLLPQVIEVLQELLGTTSAVIQADARAQQAEGFRFDARIVGELPKKVTVREHGLRFRVDVEGGHKTGFFCDQRDNRKRLGELAAGRRVLDVCTYTGGFALAAAQGGASEVTGVDIDEAALAVARTNAGLNEQPKVKWVQSDAFAYLRQMGENGERYGLIVLDPPKFIPDRASEEEGRRKYLDLNRLALRLLEPGGLLLTCSCSGLFSAAELLETLQRAEQHPDVARRMRLLWESGAGADHPVRLNCPESRYLKAAWLMAS